MAQEKKTHKFIIGAGISGLIWKFYHPDFEVISPVQDQPIKGTALTRTDTVWIHDCYETRKLLKDLGYEDVKDRIRQNNIGYYYKNWICDNLTPDINLMLIQKKMTPWDMPINRRFVPTSTELSMTSDVGVNYMQVLEVDLSDLLFRLQKACPVTHGYVKDITETTISIGNEPGDKGGNVYAQYDELISTIAAPFFWKNYNSSRMFPINNDISEFKYMPVTNIIVKDKPAVFDDRYMSIYYDDSQRFSRINKGRNQYTMEFTGRILVSEFENLVPVYKVIDHVEVPMGRIITRENISPQKNIIFSGRFAQWNHTITTEHVAHQAINYKETE